MTQPRTQIAAVEQLDIIAQIDLICEHRGISRADYLRMLIRSDIETRQPEIAQLKLKRAPSEQAPAITPAAE